MDFRIKLTEIQMLPTGNFCKGIPYRDTKLTKAEKEINIIKELESISLII